MSIPGVDVEAFYLLHYMRDYETEQAELRDDREEYLEQFETLRREIHETMY